MFRYLRRMPVQRSVRHLLVRGCLACTLLLGPAVGTVTARQASSPAPTQDGAQNIFGFSGTFSSCPNAPQFCKNTLTPEGVRGIGGNYMRIDIDLNCETNKTPDAASWNASTSIDASGATVTSLPLIQGILRAALQTEVIPVLNFTPPGPSCQPLRPVDWAKEISGFANVMYDQKWWSPDRWVYFEIGNEPEGNAKLYHSPVCAPNQPHCHFAFPAIFAAAAKALFNTLAQRGIHSYTILTGGTYRPTAYELGGGQTCNDPYLKYDPNTPRFRIVSNIIFARDAIAQAELAGVPRQYLGVAIHPYKYDTNEPLFPDNSAYVAYFINYYGHYAKNGQHYDGFCYDLGTTLKLWSSGVFQGLPLIITETNWNDWPGTIPQVASPGHTTTCDDIKTCQGTYLIDLFTWLYDHQQYASTKISPVRLDYFRPADAPGLALGVVGYTDGDKNFPVSYCPGWPLLGASGQATLAAAYQDLVSSPCY